MVGVPESNRIATKVVSFVRNQWPKIKENASGKVDKDVVSISG